MHVRGNTDRRPGPEETCIGIGVYNGSIKHLFLCGNTQSALRPRAESIKSSGLRFGRISVLFVSSLFARRRLIDLILTHFNDPIVSPNNPKSSFYRGTEDQ